MKSINLTTLQLPQPLINSLQNVIGFDEKSFVEVHEKKEVITSVRLNSNKLNKELELPIAEKIPWTTNGYYLKQRISFTLDPLFHAGCYYVQEASSMFLEQAIVQSVDLNKSLKVLDLCAAPGGKSTHIVSLLNKESFIISNEVIAARNNVLQENMIKWGNENVVITQNDAKDFGALENYFDLIVIDAPCSGSGLFRKDNEAIKEWSENNVMLCSQRQQRVIADVLPSLKNDGILIYSTCSFSVAENESIMDWLSTTMQMENIPLQCNATWNITETKTALQNTGYRFWPNLVKGEGFFLCCFKKKNEEPNNPFLKKLKPFVEIPELEKIITTKWVNQNTHLKFIAHHQSILAMPLQIANELSFLQNHLYIKLAGVNIGTIMKNQLVPEHALSTSNILNKELPKVEVNKEIALDFLRKQNIALPQNAPLGWLLIQYNQTPIGFVKNLGNRCNNYYPKNWRILMNE